jgi:hypothetical protein
MVAAMDDAHGNNAGIGNNAGTGNSADLVDERQNYDKAFKDALVFFKDKTLDFFDIGHLPPIAEPLRTEAAKVTADTDFSDLTFRLADGRGLHLEEEVDLSEKDLLRFCGYHVDLIQTYGVDFVTVMFVKNPARIKAVERGMLSFRPIIADCSERDADAALARLKRQIAAGEPVNELELLYLPIFSSKSMRPVELLREGVAIAKRLPDTPARDHLFALMMMVSNRVVSSQELKQIWEDIQMTKLKILEVAEEIGMEKGMEKGSMLRLVRMIDIKLAKNKSREQIIDELELDSEGIGVLDRIDEYRKLAASPATQSARHSAV